jgi:hypothetical protein
VQTAMKNGLLGSDVINGAMLQLIDLWLAGISEIDEELDSIVNEKCYMHYEWWCIYSINVVLYFTI